MSHSHHGGGRRSKSPSKRSTDDPAAAHIHTQDGDDEQSRSYLSFMNPLGLALINSFPLQRMHSGHTNIHSGSDDDPAVSSKDADAVTQVNDDDAKSIGLATAPPQIIHEAVLAATTPSVPDGGYGWVIVFASFMCNFIVDGIANSFGVFLPYYVESFKVSTGSAAWAGSILCGSYLCMGPIVSALTNKFGCRIICITGAFVAAMGFGLSYFANSLPLLILTYGVIGGIGFGMIYLPSIVCVGYYFEHKRAMATGIAVCGSGVGMFAFGPAAGFLLKNMRWNDVHLILVGIILCCVGFGLLMRPLVVQVVLDEDEEDEDWTEADKQFKQQKDGTTDRPPGWDDENRRGSGSSGRSVTTKGSGKIRAGSKSGSQFHFLGRTFSYKAVPLGVFGKNPQPPSVLASVVTSAVSARKSQLSMGSAKTGDGEPQNEDATSKMGTTKEEEAGTTVTGTGTEVVEEVAEVPEKPIIVRPLARKDVFYTGNLNNRAEYTGRASLSVVPTIDVPQGQPGQVVPPRKRRGTKGKCCRRVRKGADIHTYGHFLSAFLHMMDFSLLKNPVFLFLAIGNVFAMLGYFIPFVFIVNRALNKEVPSEYATLLVSIIGATNTIGRIVTGVLADLPKVRSIYLYIGCIFVAGVAVACVPFTTSFGTMVVVAVFFGFFIAGFVAIISIVLVDMLGLDKLTNAYGLLILFWGVAAIVGSPLAGALLDAFDSYDIPFWTAGGFLITASGICSMVPSVKRWQDRKALHKVLKAEAEVSTSAPVYQVGYLDEGGGVSPTASAATSAAASATPEIAGKGKV